MRQMTRWGMFFLTLALVGCTPRLLDIKRMSSGRDCKPVLTTRFSGRGGLYCAMSVGLNEDSTFQLAVGCELSGHIVTGKWRDVGDSVELRRTRFPKAHVICNVVSYGTRREGTPVKLKVFDKTGEPVGSFTISTDHTSRLVSYGRKIDKPFRTNGDGEAEVEIDNCRYIEFRQLSALTGHNHRYSTKSLADSIVITLGINGDGLHYLYYSPSIDFERVTRFKKSDSTLATKLWTLKRDKY